MRRNLLRFNIDGHFSTSRNPYHNLVAEDPIDAKIFDPFDLITRQLKEELVIKKGGAITPPIFPCVVAPFATAG
ncbi:MAG TPA: hypothetical protein VHB48_13430 [Chitinophagaceae bacterium]|nr:hypothetical protein [Chitinophagaceae bacterium]